MEKSGGSSVFDDGWRPKVHDPPAWHCGRRVAGAGAAGRQWFAVSRPRSRGTHCPEFQPSVYAAITKHGSFRLSCLKEEFALSSGSPGKLRDACSDDADVAAGQRPWAVLTEQRKHHFSFLAYSTFYKLFPPPSYSGKRNPTTCKMRLFLKA